MKANEFVKKFGWEVAKDTVKNCPPMGFLSNPFIKDNGACVRVLTTPSDFEVQFHKDLKHLVESHELVESYGGLFEAKVYADSEYRSLSVPQITKRLKQAILDVESCNENPN